MGYKKMDQNLGFSDLALSSSMEKNRSLKTLSIFDPRGSTYKKIFI